MGSIFVLFHFFFFWNSSPGAKPGPLLFLLLSNTLFLFYSCPLLHYFIRTARSLLIRVPSNFLHFFCSTNEPKLKSPVLLRPGFAIMKIHLFGSHSPIPRSSIQIDQLFTPIAPGHIDPIPILLCNERDINLISI